MGSMIFRRGMPPADPMLLCSARPIRRTGLAERWVAGLRALCMI